MPTARTDENKWVRCARCGHKLGRIMGVLEGQRSFPAIEIKCHSCKAINYIMVGEKKDDVRNQ